MKHKDNLHRDTSINMVSGGETVDMKRAPNNAATHDPVADKLVKLTDAMAANPKLTHGTVKVTHGLDNPIPKDPNAASGSTVSDGSLTTDGRP